MSNERVSIVVPAFNAANFVKETIDSLLSQNYDNLEIIAIDDGSTDNTSEILQQYADRITVLKHENCGQAATLNKGWKLSQGDYFGYLSADDVLMPNAISECVNVLSNRSEVVVVYPDNELVDAKTRHIRDLRLKLFSPQDVIQQGSIPIAVGALFTRAVFEKTQGWNESYHLVSDVDFWLRASELGEFVHIPKILGKHRVHSTSANFAKTTRARADEFKHMITDIVNNSQEEWIVKNKTAILARAMLVSGRFHWRSRRFVLGVQYFLKSFIMDPASITKVSTIRILVNALLNKPAHRIIAMLRNVNIRGR